MTTPSDSPIMLRGQLKLAEEQILRQFKQFEQFQKDCDKYDTPFKFDQLCNSPESKFEFLRHKNDLSQHILQLIDYIELFDTYPSFPLKILKESNLPTEEKTTLLNNLQTEWNKSLDEHKHEQRLDNAYSSLRSLKMRLSEIETLLDLCNFQLDNNTTSFGNSNAHTAEIPSKPVITTATRPKSLSAILQPVTKPNQSTAQASKTASDPSSTTNTTLASTDNPISSLNSLVQLITTNLEDKAVYQNIKIPEFNGDSTQFDSFMEMFLALIDAKPISNLHKLAFLKGLCIHDAAKCLESIPTIGDYYTHALDLLRRQYGDKKANKLHLIRTLRSIPESPLKGKALQNTLCDIVSISRRLLHLGENLNSIFLEDLILTKFPSKIRNKCISRLFQQSKDTETGSVTTNTLLDFLEDIILEFVHCELHNPQPNTATTKNYNSTNHKTTIRCLACHKEHSFRQCPKYDTSKLRYEYVKRHKLCSKCFTPKHHRTQCDKPDCKYCNKPHHTAICFQTDNKDKDKAATAQSTRSSNNPDASSKSVSFDNSRSSSPGRPSIN